MFHLSAMLHFQVLKVLNSKIPHNAKYSNITDNNICTEMSSLIITIHKLLKFLLSFLESFGSIYFYVL